MIIRQIGLLISIIMLAALCAPLVVTYLLATSKIGSIPGLVASGMIAPLLYISAMNLLIIWKASPWTSSERKPDITGVTFMGALVYCLLAFLVGFLLQMGIFQV